MRICLIVDDYLPHSKKIAAKAMHDLAVEFLQQGHLVTVVTPNQRLDSKNSKFTLDGVTVLEFASGRTKDAPKSIRLLSETLFSIRAWIAYKHYFRKNRHDFIVYYSPSIFWGVLVLYLKRIWGVRSYLILRDLFPQWVIDQGLISPGSPVAMYLRFFEFINYRAADIIGLQSPENKNWFLAAKLSSKPVEVLFNWARMDPTAGIGNSCRKGLGLDGKVVFFYGGNIGPAQDMKNIAVLAKHMLQYSNAHFLLVGSGAEVEILMKMKENDRLTNLSVLPAVDQAEYRNMLAEFDVGLFCLHRDHTTHNFPGKLLEYMNQSKPILGCVNLGNDLKLIVEGACAGYITFTGDDKSLFDNAVRLLNDSELRCNLGKNGNQLLNSVFSVKKASDQILKHVPVNLNRTDSCVAG